MDDLPELETVISQAVRVYLIAKKRCALMRSPNHPELSAQKLAEQYPDYFEQFSGKGAKGEMKYRVIGKTADDLLEEYLAKLGYPRNSELWYSLANIVIERGEFESEQDPDLFDPHRQKRRGYHG